MVAMRTLLGRVATDNLAEKGTFLIDERELPLVEFLKELVPGDFRQRVVLGLRIVRKHDADDSDIALLMRAADRGGLAALRLRPFANLVMIGRGLGHVAIPFSSDRVQEASGLSAARLRASQV